MDNSVFFDLHLRDYNVATGLKNIGGTSHSVFSGVDNDINRTQRGMDDLGNPVHIKVDTSGFRDAHREVDSLKDKMHELSEMRLVGGMAMGELVARGVERGFDFAKDQVADIFKEGMGAAKTEAQIKVMAGDKEGEDLYKETHAYIPTSMFGPELFQDEKVLLGMGEKVKNIMTDVRQIGDISMGDAQKMESIILALGETISQGKFTALQQRILRPTGFNPLQALHDATGVSVEKLTEKMEAGEFSVDMFRKSMEVATQEGGRFFEMQKKISETPFGKERIMETNVEMAKEELGVNLLPVSARVMDAFKPLIDELPEALDKLQPSLEKLGNSFADMIKWTADNTDTIKTWVSIAKTGAEAFIAWKVGTAALTAANWVWTASVGAATTENIANTVAIDAETAALVEQGAVLEGLGLKWAAMGATEREAMLAASQGAFSLPTMGLAAGSMANSAAAGLAGSFASGVSGAVLPVAVMYFAGEALNAFLPKDGDGHQMKWEMLLTEQGRMQAIDILFGAHPGVADMNKRNSRSSIGDAWDISGFGKNGDDSSEAEAARKKTKSELEQMLQGMSDSITGGGQKNVNITFRNFVENLYNQSATKGEGQAWTLRELKTMLAELLSSIN